MQGCDERAIDGEAAMKPLIGEQRLAGSARTNARRMRAAGGTAPGARQRGVALIIGLVILVVLAMLGVSAYSVATQDERLAGNARDHARAMDAAQTILRACEAYIENNAPAFNGTNGFLAPPSNGQWWAFSASNSSAPWSVNTVPFNLLPTMLALQNAANPPDWMTNPPQCIAEAVPPNLPKGQPTPRGMLNVAHVAAQGYGINSTTVVTLETYVAYY